MLESDAPLTIIDWQVAFLGRGAADLAYFAAFCLSKEQRRSVEYQMVDIYHRTLLAGGVFGYDIDQCWEDYRFATLTAVLRLITAGAMLDFSSERGRALVAAIGDRVDAMLTDHHVADLVSMVEEAERG
jgi:hypothetical protein